MSEVKLPKIKWRVQPAPTGRYRSFDRRGWPTAEYEDGSYCASIYCEDEYVPARVKTGDHRPLTLMIRDRSTDPQWKRVRASKQFTTLEEAKAALAKILVAHPHLMGDKTNV